MTWDSLLTTSDKKIRYCTECDRGVHYCDDDAELNEAIRKNWCVAIGGPEKAPHEDVEVLIGDVGPDYFN
jgi:hypothetical protein